MLYLCIVYWFSFLLVVLKKRSKNSLELKDIDEMLLYAWGPVCFVLNVAAQCMALQHKFTWLACQLHHRLAMSPNKNIFTAQLLHYFMHQFFFFNVLWVFKKKKAIHRLSFLKSGPAVHHENRFHTIYPSAAQLLCWVFIRKMILNISSFMLSCPHALAG